VLTDTEEAVPNKLRNFPRLGISKKFTAVFLGPKPADNEKR